MRPRVLASTLFFCLAASGVAALPPALAQQATTISTSTRAPELNDLLKEGQRLETMGRWGEALAHYEDAMRLFPGEGCLKRRFEQSRVHYDLARRYTDRSFRDAVLGLSPESALELYLEILLKIQAHYVESPDWEILVGAGTESFEVALREPTFREWNLRGGGQAEADRLAAELRCMLGRRAIKSRREAGEAVAEASALAHEHLNISQTAVVLEYLCGATNALDRYSAYLTPDQLNEVYAQIEGNFVGLGIELKTEDGGLTIVRVIPGSPAEQAGIRAGDRIVSVDGSPTRHLSAEEAANRLQGEAGTLVTLAVETPGADPRVLEVHRRRVEVPSIDEAKILDPLLGVGYFRLVSFQKTTCQDVEATLWRLHRQGMRSLILDLRRNPGGLLVAAVEVADKFLDRGIIVATRGRSVQEDCTYCAHRAGTWQVPLVVMIDRDSASAAEILAGAIRDHHRGTIVGQRSYGKGSVQGIFPLDFVGAGVRLTTARFYSPTGRPYSQRGVDPDVEVRRAYRPPGGQVDLDETDDALAAALQVARQLSPTRN